MSALGVHLHAALGWLKPCTGLASRLADTQCACGTLHTVHLQAKSSAAGQIDRHT